MRRAWRSFLAAGFYRFSGYRKYRWGDSSIILVQKHGSEAISECLILNIFLGEHAPRPPGSGPALNKDHISSKHTMCAL